MYAPCCPPDDAFVDQDAGLYDREVYLRLSRAGAFPVKTVGKKRVARWGDVKTAFARKGAAITLSEPTDDPEADLMNEVRQKLGLATKGLADVQDSYGLAHLVAGYALRELAINGQRRSFRLDTLDEGEAERRKDALVEIARKLRVGAKEEHAESFCRHAAADERTLSAIFKVVDGLVVGRERPVVDPTQGRSASTGEISFKAVGEMWYLLHEPRSSV